MYFKHAFLSFVYEKCVLYRESRKNDQEKRKKMTKECVLYREIRGNDQFLSFVYVAKVGKNDQEKMTKNDN